MPEKEHVAQKIIGSYTRAENGKRKRNTTAQDMPKEANDTDGDMGEAEGCSKRQMKTTHNNKNMTKENCNRDTRKYTTTWTSPAGNTRRKIYYITTNAKYRNVTRKAQSNIDWHANMNQNQQHRAQTIQLYYNTTKKYKQSIPPETGYRLKYDIIGLRLHPEKLTQGYQEHETERRTT